MEELGECSLPVIEFKSNNYAQRMGSVLVENGTNTVMQTERIEAWTETTQLCCQTTQTEFPKATKYLTNEYEDQLAIWLHRIAPYIEKELRKPNEIFANVRHVEMSKDTEDYGDFHAFQKIVIEAADGSLAVAAWLAVYTHNAPALIVSVIAAHEGWCQHIRQTIRLYIPSRIPDSDRITYKEMKSVPIKACLRSLVTNSFNRNIFAGSTFNDDIYVWQFEPNVKEINSFNIQELFHINCSSYGFAVAMDWPHENALLTAHPNGYIIQWQLVAGSPPTPKSPEFAARLPFEHETKEISALLSLNLKDFIVGTRDGGVYHCWNWSVASMKSQIKATCLEQHSFAVSTLLKAHSDGNIVIISCDVSGEVHYHDLKNQSEVETDCMVLQIPLPFQNHIACSTDGRLIYYSDNGRLQCYGYRRCIINSTSSSNSLRGKSNFIKRSDNGCWIVTGLHDDQHIQIFAMDL